MCFPADSVPPIAPISGASVDHSDLVLEADDGNRFAAFSASAPDAAVGVVILPDVRGLFRFYEELALRFAERGHDAVAFDYFGRTAGVAKRDNDWDYMTHVGQTTQDGVKADVAASIALLRQGRENRPVFTVGFCFGGSNSWHQAANGLDLAGAIGFYGNPLRENVPLGSPSVVSRSGEIECPVLGLMGGDDPGIPPEAVEAFDAALLGAGVEHELVTYPGAPHSFFDRAYEQYAHESEDAWNRVLAFIDSHS